MGDVLFTIPEDKVMTESNSTQSIVDEFIEKRILVFNTEVDETLLENYVLYILKWNAEDNNAGIPIKKRKTIKIYFNSPGGDLFSGGMFMDVISTSKTPIIGVAFSLVGSMAYHIYLSCPIRVAFVNSIFCQHEGDVAISNASSKVKDVMEFFNDMDERLKQHILNHTTMSLDFITEKEKNEYYMFAQEAYENGIVHKIIGKDVSINYIL